MEEARTKEEVKEHKHNRKRSPMWTNHNPRNSKEDATKMDARTTPVKGTGDTEDITIRGHMSMERGISRKMSPNRNGKW